MMICIPVSYTHLNECTTNGYTSEDTVYFMTADPQICWDNKRKIKVRSVRISAVVAKEFDAKTMDIILAKHSSVLAFAKKHLR